MNELNAEPIKENEIVRSTIEIKYQLPKFHHRVLANLIDILLVAFVFICSFLACRSIILNSDSYKISSSTMKTEQLNSGLYKEKQGEIINLVSYINDGGFTAKGKAEEAKKGIVQISDYIVKFMSEEIILQKEKTYTNYFLDESMVFVDEGVTYPYVLSVSFSIVDGVYKTFLELNTEVMNFPYLKAYTECLKPFLSDYCFSIFQSYDVEYKQALISINNSFVYIALPISYALAGLLVYFVPPIIFRKGRKTIGKLLYKIGLVNKNCFIPSFKLWLLRFIIFYFAIYCLSLLTFGLPMIISFTIMAVSKKKQGFADYMLNLTEVDCSRNKVYFNEEEIYFERIRAEKDPIDFKLKDTL